MEKDMKSYPNNLLRQLFPGEQFDNLADDSGIALDYVISETMKLSISLDTFSPQNSKSIRKCSTNRNKYP